MPKKILFGLFAYGLAIVQFFLSVSFGWFEGISDSVNGEMFSFLLSMLIILMTDRFADLADRDNLHGAIEKIFLRFDQLVKTEVMTANESIPYITKQIPKARVVRSTTIVLNKEMMDVSDDLHFYSVPYKKFLEVKQNCIKNGLVW